MPDFPAIVVTGANGLLGRHAVVALRDEYCVHALVHSIPDVRVADVTYHSVDLSGEWIINTLPRKIHAVIHLAQSSRFREFPEQALDVFRVNVASTARLLDYALVAGARKFFFASTGGVYGSRPKPFCENDPVANLHGLGYYVGSKVSGEIMASSYARLMDIKILRIFFMYGPEQRRSMLIPRLADNVLQSRPISLAGSDGIRINPVHVRDAVALIKVALEHPGSQTINVAGPDALSLREIAEVIGMHSGRAAKFIQESASASDLLGNNDLMESMLPQPLARLCEHLSDVIEKA